MCLRILLGLKIFEPEDSPKKFYNCPECPASSCNTFPSSCSVDPCRFGAQLPAGTRTILYRHLKQDRSRPDILTPKVSCQLNPLSLLPFSLRCTFKTKSMPIKSGTMPTGQGTIKGAVVPASLTSEGIPHALRSIEPQAIDIEGLIS